MSVQAGTYEVGPEDATLWVETGRQGAAAKAGHDLVIDVTSWRATLELGDDGAPSGLELAADAGSLSVREGSGGLQPLGDGDKAEIGKTIDDEVLRDGPIAFRSAAVEAGDGGELHVTGDLELAGASHRVEFGLSIGPDGAISGTATVTQSDFGIKPYSALFGALKVADDVRVRVEGTLPS